MLSLWRTNGVFDGEVLDKISFADKPIEDPSKLAQNALKNVLELTSKSTAQNPLDFDYGDDKDDDVEGIFNQARRTSAIGGATASALDGQKITSSSLLDISTAALTSTTNSSALPSPINAQPPPVAAAVELTEQQKLLLQLLSPITSQAAAGPAPNEGEEGQQINNTKRSADEIEDSAVPKDPRRQKRDN